ncbi:hypothetical protein ACQP3L_38565, partial [Escherichia coli]
IQAPGYSGVRGRGVMHVENHGGRGFWKRLLFISRQKQTNKQTNTEKGRAVFAYFFSKFLPFIPIGAPVHWIVSLTLKV